MIDQEYTNKEKLKAIPDLSLLEDYVFDEMVSRKIEQEIMRNKVSFEEYLIYLVDGYNEFQLDELDDELSSLYDDILIKSLDEYRKKYQCNDNH